MTDPGRFADLVAGYLELPAAERQALLETLAVEERLRRVLVHVQRQIGMLNAQAEIKTQVQEELGERQREMYLREQLKAIQKELGEDDPSRELTDLREKLLELDLPEEARAEVERELGPARAVGPRVDGGAGHPHLPRMGRRTPLGHAVRRRPRPQARRRASSTRTTTA